MILPTNCKLLQYFFQVILHRTCQYYWPGKRSCTYKSAQSLLSTVQLSTLQNTRAHDSRHSKQIASFNIGDHRNISKCSPADFDSALYSHTKPIKLNKTLITFVSPLRMMRCLTCSRYILRGTKFRDATKTTQERNSAARNAPETCLGIEIYLLHAKCPNCKAAIVLHVDP